MKALRIPADSEQPVELVDVTVTLDWLQGQVGGYIDVVRVERILTDAGRRLAECSVYVNDEGKLIGLPVNSRATDLCSLKIGGWIFDVIKGDVVVLGVPDRRGEDTAVPDAVVRIVRRWGWLR